MWLAAAAFASSLGRPTRATSSSSSSSRATGVGGEQEACPGGEEEGEQVKSAPELATDEIGNAGTSSRGSLVTPSQGGENAPENSSLRQRQRQRQRPRVNLSYEE
jgi:hypothetical protein